MNHKILSKFTGVLIVIALLFLTVGLVRAEEWGFGAGLVPPGVSMGFDGTELVQTGLNTEGGEPDCNKELML